MNEFQNPVKLYTETLPQVRINILSHYTAKEPSWDTNGYFFRDIANTVYWILEDGGGLEDNYNLYKFKKGEIYFLPAGANRRLINHSKVNKIWCSFNLLLGPGVDLLEEKDKILQIKNSNFGKFCFPYFLDQEEFSISDWTPLDTKRMELEILNLLNFCGYSIDDIYRHRQQKQSKFTNLITYIEEHIQKPLDINSLTTHFNKKNAAALSADFKNHMGIALKQYILNRKLEKAKEYLTLTKLKLSEIAPLCGFDDVYYFNRLFSKKENISPGKFRKIHSFSK